MSEDGKINVAIVDYGLGNLFSVKNACEQVGVRGTITSSKDEILAASAVILPGVGAFGDAMGALRNLGLVGPLRELAGTGKPLVGICLGMQLLMEQSVEFGEHEGLGIIPGRVVRFEGAVSADGRALKVPQVGWNRVWQRSGVGHELLGGIPQGEYLYFVHSFYVVPRSPDVIMSTSLYGGIEFCSSISYSNVFGCQFHPERSGPAGLLMYGSLKKMLSGKLEQ